MKKLIFALSLFLFVLNANSNGRNQVRLKSARFENNILNLIWDIPGSTIKPNRFIICVSDFHSQSDCINAPANEKFYTIQLDPKKSNWIRKSRWGYNFIESLYPHDKEFMDQFRGKQVNIIVWGCSNTDGCKKSNSIIFRVPYASGTFEAELAPILKSQTCLNCHNMQSKGGKWREHIREGRFTRTTDTSDEYVCMGCHNAGTGFADRWRAPNPRSLAYNGYNLTVNEICKQIKRAGGASLGHHLLHDPLIFWGLRKDNVNLNEWRNKVRRIAPRGARDVICSPEGKANARINRNYRTGTKRCFSHHTSATCIDYPSP